MSAFLITYDLIKPDRNYDELYKAIKAISGTWCHPVESVWAVKDSGPSSAIRDALTPHMDGNDKLLVLKLSGEGAWRNLSKELTDWLQANL